MDSSLPLRYHLTHPFALSRKLKGLAGAGTLPFLSGSSLTAASTPWNKRTVTRLARASLSSPPFRLFEPLQVEEPSSELEPADPDFYRIGYVRSVRAYGVEFKEGPDGFGVYASRDVEPLRRARIIMEIPLELMLTISQKVPWMFFPDIVPVGHPIFDIINSTNPESDWDLRLACLLLFALDVEGNFWQLYGDFLPSEDECTSLLLATKDELLELQDRTLASRVEMQQHRGLEFWEKNWHSAVPLKIKRLARDPERFIWALSIVHTRSINMKMRVGALVQDANMLVPYAGNLFLQLLSYMECLALKALQISENAGEVHKTILISFLKCSILLYAILENVALEPCYVENVLNLKPLKNRVEKTFLK